MTFSRTSIGLLLALLIADSIILFTAPDGFWWRFPAALALVFVLPGWAWLSALNWLQTSDAVERLVLIPGLSSVLSALALFMALLLPGPFTETPNLIALNLATLTGLLWEIVIGKLVIGNWSLVNRQTLISTPTSLRSQPPSGRNLPTSNLQPPTSNLQLPTSNFPSRAVLIILLAIVAVAAFTRLTRLGYAEFHEDELENMRLIVRAYKGEEYAPYLDSKGPIHWLLPAALWYLNGWVNEDIARTPFVLTSLLLVPLMYSLGRRMSGGRDSVGLLAAGFVGVNGFFVALARHVENRALIVFWGALAVWLAYRYYKENKPQFLLYTAVTMAIGLIAHPEVSLYLPVFGYIVWLKISQDRLAWRQWPWLLAATLVLAGLTALFYVPYLTDPEIGLVYQYFATERVGESFLYNLVGNIFVEDALYTTRYHGPILVLLLIWLLAREFAQWRWRGWTLLAGLGAAMTSVVVWPDVWIIAGENLAFIPYALLGLAFMALPKTSAEIKINFLWFLITMGALVFLAKDASNHVQVAYPGWIMLSAFALADLWACLSTADRRPPTANPQLTIDNSQFTIHNSFPRLLKGVIVLALALIIPLIIFYQYLSFDAQVKTYWQAKIDVENNPNSIYNWLYGGLARPRRAISNPRLGGWKAVGYLWNQGAISGDFRSVNESFAVPVWYTFQTPRSCYDDPQNYWVRNDWKGWPEEEKELPGQGYTLTRIVLVDNASYPGGDNASYSGGDSDSPPVEGSDSQPMLHLYEKNAPLVEPQVLDMEAYRQQFDRLMTPARMAQEEPINHPASANFGDKLLLRGYNLPETTAHPGDLLPVTVSWESLAFMDIRYRGFMHLIGRDGTRRAQHDDDPACRLLTTEMRPGQRSSRQFRLPIDPATPPGDYQIIFGLYNPDTQERLPIWDNLAGQSPGDSLVLGQVRVE